jgi:hypothetical protein
MSIPNLILSQANILSHFNSDNNTQYLKNIMVNLNYKIPVIDNENMQKILNHFIQNKVKFSKCKNGRGPYISFFRIIDTSIQELGLPISLKLESTIEYNNVDADNYLIIKKNQ